MVNSSDRSGKHLRQRHGGDFIFLKQISRLTNYMQREELGALVSLEMGKIRTEGVGEVQEFVDIVSRFPRSARHHFDLLDNNSAITLLVYRG